MLNTIRSIVYEVTGISDLTEDTDFVKDLGLNSLDVVSIVGAFEDKYGIEVPVRELWQLHTVRDAMDYMAKKNIGTEQ